MKHCFPNKLMEFSRIVSQSETMNQLILTSPLSILYFDVDFLKLWYLWHFQPIQLQMKQINGSLQEKWVRKHVQMNFNTKIVDKKIPFHCPFEINLYVFWNLDKVCSCTGTERVIIININVVPLFSISFVSLSLILKWN